MNEVMIIEHKKEPRIDSRLLAPALDHRHRTILENIDKYSQEMLEFGPLPFESERGIELPQGGFAKATRYALLNEDQCYFLLTLMRNNATIISKKVLLVKAFRDARAGIARRDIARIEGKEVRKCTTQAIKDLVEYAGGQGSKSAEKYYMNISKMTNKMLGIEAGQRDNLDVSTLRQITAAETVIDIAIRDGLKAELHYKDIYKLAKDRVQGMLPSIGIENKK